MRCERVRERLNTYLDAEAGNWEPLERHLSECAKCAAEAEAIKLLTDFVKTADTQECDLWPALEEKIDKEEREGLVRELAALKSEISLLREEMSALRQALERTRPRTFPEEKPGLLLPYRSEHEGRKLHLA